MIKAVILHNNQVLPLHDLERGFYLAAEESIKDDKKANYRLLTAAPRMCALLTDIYAQEYFEK